MVVPTIHVQERIPPGKDSPMANFTLASVPAARPDNTELLEVLGPHLEELRQHIRDFRQATPAPPRAYDLEKKWRRRCVRPAGRFWSANTIMSSRSVWKIVRYG